MWFTKRDGTVPAPFVVAPSGLFEGSDGNWSTFKLDVGSPAQEFRVLISNLAGAVWLPNPAGCESAATIGGTESECSSARGIQPYNGGTSPGFQSDQSSSWQNRGTQKLSLSSEPALGSMSQVYGGIYDLGAVYGEDTIALQSQSSNGEVSAADTPLATIVDPFDFTLGSLGLAFGELKVQDSAGPTFMESIANDSSIPSRSWAYTAGAVYGSNGDGVAGSLVLGGYDELRVKGEGASFAMPIGQQTLLRVKVQGLSIAHSNGSQSSPTVDSDGQVSPFNAILDFTLPYLYLPDSIVDAFVSSLALTYDNASDIYFWNGTQSSVDVESFTFNLQDTQTGENSTSIDLPFAAFNLTASWPLSSYTYFPIRKSPDSTYILGRSFFQEAYVIADYERRNFTVAQAAFPTSASTQLVTIFNTTYQQDSGGPAPDDDGSLGGGAIAGIVIGVVLGVTFLVLAYFLWRRRKRAAGKQNSQAYAAAFESAQEEKLGQRANLNRERSDTVLSDETAGSYELASMPGLTQRPSHQRHVSELSSDSERTMQNKLRSQSAIYEMPDTSYLAANEQQPHSRSHSQTQWRHRSTSPAASAAATAVEAPTRETSTRTAQTAPSPIMTAISPAMSSREPLSGVAEAPSPATSPATVRQASSTPTRGLSSKFSERSSDMQP